MYLAICAVASLLETTALLSPGNIFNARTLQTWFAFFSTQYIAIKLYHIFIYPFHVSPLRHLPGPKNNTFFVGQIVNQFRSPSPNTEYVSWVKRWPDAPFIRYLSMGNSEVLLVNSLTAHREVLQTQCYSFIKPIFFERLISEIVGRGLLFAVGEEHRRQRRQLTGPFSYANIRKLLPIFQEKSKGLITYLESVIQSDPSQREGIFEVESAFVRTTLDVIGMAALGVELDNLSVAGSSMNFAECYHTTLGQSGLAAVISFLNVFVPLRWLPIRANRRYLEAIAGLRMMLQKVIQERGRNIEKREQSDETYQQTSKDILTFMIEAIDSGEAKWTEEEIIDHLLQFVSAGHETIAGVLVWATYVLATRQDIQDRLRGEVLGALADNSHPDASTIENMRYLNNFIQECLRVYSPALMAPREASKDVWIDNVMIPKGTLLIIAPAAVQSNPAIWGEDADEFRPERWNELAGDSASPFALEAFTNGPRICLGKGFAMLQLKTVLVDILRTFVLEQFETLSGYENPALTLKPKGGLRVRVRKLVAP